MDITVRVEVQYVAPERALVRDVLQMFRTPAWVRFMVRYISPHLKNAAPADKAVVDNLAPWRAPASSSCSSPASSDCSCVICMSDLSGGGDSDSDKDDSDKDDSDKDDDSEKDGAAVRLPCGHCFHGACIRSWLKLRSTCPSCRFQFRKAFAGSYAVRTLNSALLLKPEHRRMRRDAVLDASVSRETVRAVVHVTLSQVPAAARQNQYPCVLNALLMHANGDSFSEPPLMDKGDAAAAAADASPAAASARRSARVRRASEMERDAADEHAKRLRVA